MIGSLFAGTDETPGEIVLFEGRSFKSYRGMGSIEAMKGGSKDRYGQAGVEEAKLVAEGIEGRVPYKGRVADSIYQLIGGLRAGLGYCGTRTLAICRKRVASCWSRPRHCARVTRTTSSSPRKLQTIV